MWQRLFTAVFVGLFGPFLFFGLLGLLGMGFDHFMRETPDSTFWDSSLKILAVVAVAIGCGAWAWKRSGGSGGA